MHMCIGMNIYVYVCMCIGMSMYVHVLVYLHKYYIYVNIDNIHAYICLIFKYIYTKQEN